MLQFVFNPRWFFGVDSVFEAVSFLVTLLLAIYAYRLYEFSEDKRYKYFGFAFFMIAISFLFKILTNITIYFPQTEEAIFGFIRVKAQIIEQSTALFQIGFLLHRFFMMFGLLSLYYSITTHIKKRQLLLLTYFIAITAIFSRAEYLVFYITTSLFSFFIFLHAFRNHVQKHTQQTLYVAGAFFMLLISQITFIFIYLTTYFYVIAEAFQLLGYLILLAAYYSLVIKK